eukprot:gene25860-biopygen24021
MGPEVGPAFQRRPRPTFCSFLASGWRKRCPGIRVQKKGVFFLAFGRGITYKIHVLGSFAIFAFLSRGANYPAISCFRIAMRTSARAQARK